MRNILRQCKLLGASLLLGALLSYGFTAPVAAQGAAGAAKNEVCQGVSLGGGSCNSNGSDISHVVALVVNILSIVAGVAAVIMLIIAGLRYVTSGGDSTAVSGAKSAIIYALAGLVVVALSQFIVRYVLGRTVNG